MHSMSAANIASISVFLLGLLVAGLWPFISSALEQRPSERIRQRLRGMTPAAAVAEQVGIEPPLDPTRSLRNAIGIVRYWHLLVMRIRSLGGQRLLVLTALFAVALAAGLYFLASRVLNLSPLIILSGIPAIVVVAVALLLATLENRRATRFLNAFPEALEYLIRSVRSGIPVAHAIRLAATEVNEPVGSEFRRIGDSLAVGIDLKDTLEESCRRVSIADFTFFSVCLLLQRETGGQLTATLENLSNILRERRELRQRAKAITAEGRMSAKIIGALPILTLGALEGLSPDYITVLFSDPLGLRMLTLAGLLLCLGLLVIRHLTTLRT